MSGGASALGSSACASPSRSHPARPARGGQPCCSHRGTARCRSSDPESCLREHAAAPARHAAAQLRCPRPFISAGFPASVRTYQLALACTPSRFTHLSPAHSHSRVYAQRCRNGWLTARAVYGTICTTSVRPPAPIAPHRVQLLHASGAACAFGCVSSASGIPTTSTPACMLTLIPRFLWRSRRRSEGAGVLHEPTPRTRH
jgi:hypothetical protein